VAEGHQAVEQLRRAVSDLPEEQQMTFLLRHFHGLSYEEVAQILGIPLGTVKWRLHDTMQRLKRSLAAHRKEGRAW
jgi:RNA polymerase sigma-70 factor (ECF subfamily)